MCSIGLLVKSLLQRLGRQDLALQVKTVILALGRVERGEQEWVVGRRFALETVGSHFHPDHTPPSVGVSPVYISFAPGRFQSLYQGQATVNMHLFKDRFRQ